MLLSLKFLWGILFTQAKRGGEGNLSPNTPFVFQNELKFILQLPKICFMLFNLRGQSYARMDAKFDKKQFQKISSEKFIHCTALRRRRRRRRGWEKQTFIHSKPKEVSKVIFWCRNQKIGEQRHREFQRPFGWELTEGWRMLGADNVPPSSSLPLSLLAAAPLSALKPRYLE